MAWAEALRSGHYKQATGVLREVDINNTTTGFCCLGVLCNLHAQAHPEIAAKQTDPCRYLGQDEILPLAVAKWAGMHDKFGTLRSGTVDLVHCSYTNLIDVNDSGANFKDIADWIENNYQRL